MHSFINLPTLFSLSFQVAVTTIGLCFMEGRPSCATRRTREPIGIDGISSGIVVHEPKVEEKIFILLYLLCLFFVDRTRKPVRAPICTNVCFHVIINTVEGYLMSFSEVCLSYIRLFYPRVILEVQLCTRYPGSYGTPGRLGT